MTPESIAAVGKEAERLEEDVLYAEKQHFSMATVWRRIHLSLGIPGSIFAALAGLSAVSAKPVLAAALAMCSAILTALLTFLNPAKTGTAHHQAGIQYNHLRGKLRRLHEIDLLSGPSTDLRGKLDEFAGEKTRIMETAPHIGGFAYRLGKASILREEHKHAVHSG